LKSFGRIPALLEHDQFVKDQISNVMKNNRLSIAHSKNPFEFLDIREGPTRVHSEVKLRSSSIVENNRAQVKIKGSLANILNNQRNIKPHQYTSETLPQISYTNLDG
jgi:hypothetical protein